jgi:outer membrane protein assembly factor BamB
MKALRLWPGVVLLAAQWLLRFGVPLVAPDMAIVGVIGGVGLGLAIAVWWIFFSRAPWFDRLGAIVLMIVAVAATYRIVDPSIAGGMMGMLLVVYSIPILSLALVGWAVSTRYVSSGVRRLSLFAAIVFACAPWALVRTAGLIGGGSEFHWRWTETPEQRLLARVDDEPKAVSPPPTPPETREPLAGKTDETRAPSKEPSATAMSEPGHPEAMETHIDWPGFRGPDRDAIVRGVRLNVDWSAAPPIEMWHRPIGPGWSSFAVSGDLLYTQEQRGEDEIVASYKVSTGEPVWRHRDPVRFWESNGGAGPRATPTIGSNRVYTFGATGILNALDAGNGKVIWSRNAATDTGREVPGWGFASSPLVVGDVVIVAVSGTLAAYDRATGRPRWVGPAHGGSYSSPQQTTIDGVPQILLENAVGVISVAPGDGKLLWEHSWPGSAIVQPAVIGPGDLLINTTISTGGVGIRRLSVTHSAGGWTTGERWTSNELKPYFNDFVVHKGYAYGFDGHILACIDLENGKRTWKGGRYGNGQLVLLPDQDLLLVLSEDGELALVGAEPNQFKELARVPAIDGKTWNHPALVGNVLLVRNGQEMAAFRLSLAEK